MKTLKDNVYYFECSCTDTEHTLCVRFDPEYKEVYVCTQLSTRSGFFKRLWTGLKYIFGGECKYGHWEETLLNEDDFSDLFDLMLLFSHKAGIKGKSAKKIREALDDIAAGNANSAVTVGLHSEEKRDMLIKGKK